MKKLISYTSIAFFATLALALASPDKDKLIENEKAAWQTFKDKKTDEFRKYLAADFRGAYSDGVYNLDKEMESLKKMDLKSFALSDFDVVLPNADTGMLTYKVTMQFTIDGKDHTGTYNAASVWQRNKGDWQVLFHSNVEQEKP